MVPGKDPAIRRVVVPLFPTSEVVCPNALQTVKTFAMYDHRILTVFDFDPEITEQWIVARQSAPCRKLYDRCAFCDGANIIQRWEMDLSPGTDLSF